MAEHTFDRGGQDDGTLTVSLDRSYGDEYVWTALDPAVTGFGLTADQARTYAADLITHAAALDGMRPRQLGGYAAPVEFTVNEHGTHTPHWPTPEPPMTGIPDAPPS
jgi:hypothetical protein